MMNRKGENIVIPPWLTNTELAAPCPCGNPIGEEFYVYRGETGLVRLFHPGCVNIEDLEDCEDD